MEKHNYILKELDSNLDLADIKATVGKNKFKIKEFRSLSELKKIKKSSIAIIVVKNKKDVEKAVELGSNIIVGVGKKNKAIILN